MAFAVIFPVTFKGVISQFVWQCFSFLETVSDAIRMMFVQAVSEKALPFEVKVPNAETVAALHDSRNGKVTRVTSVEELLKSINEE